MLEDASIGTNTVTLDLWPKAPDLAADSKKFIEFLWIKVRTRRDGNDKQHRYVTRALKIDVEGNRSVNHLPTDACSNLGREQVVKETDVLLTEQGPASLRKKVN